MLHWKHLLTRSLVFHIGVVLVCFIFYDAEHSLINHRSYFRWIGLAASSAVTFGFPVKWYRRYGRKKLFWLALLTLLSAHLLIFTVVLLNVDHFGLLWYCIITPFEWALIMPILEDVGDGLRPKWSLYRSIRK